jgi:hypothetical protein
LAAAALEGLEKGRFLAADICAGPRVNGDLESEIGAEDAGPEESRIPRFADRFAKAGGDQGVLAAHIDVSRADADAVGGDDEAFDQLVRGADQDETVLERARLTLVGVDAEVFRRAAPRHEPPLHARRKSGPAPPAQHGFPDLADDRLRRHGRDRLAGRPVAAAGKIRSETPGPVVGREERQAVIVHEL